MVKPKKALKGLFARTEPAEDAAAPQPAPIPARPEQTVVARTAAAPAEDVTSHQALDKVQPVAGAARMAAPVEPIAPVELEAPAPQVNFTAAMESVPAQIESSEQVVADVTSHQIGNVTSHQLMDETQLVSTAESVVEINLGPIAMTVAPEITNASEVTVLSQAPLALENASLAPTPDDRTDALLKIQYNFDRLRDERARWNEKEYEAFIRRLDAAQTEAFLLKGKLLDEVKRRFFEDNKVGWKKFCEDALSMNYTTANQYIRVAQEFDVTSHHRPDFGFEHFKALLPLPAPQRTEIMETLQDVSVKTLRRIVQEKLQPTVPGVSIPKADAKQMVKILQNLKLQIFECNPDDLTQTQRWQLSAACKNLSDELAALADALNASPRRAAHGHQRASASAHAHAELDVTSHFDERP